MNKRMAGMLRCRESQIVKHVCKVHLPKSNRCLQFILRPRPPTAESSQQSCLSLYLSYGVILAQLPLGPHWGRFSILLTNLVLKLINLVHFKWKGHQSLCIPTPSAQQRVPSCLLEDQMGEQGPRGRAGKRDKNLGMRIDSKAQQNN